MRAGLLCQSQCCEEVLRRCWWERGQAPAPLQFEQGLRAFFHRSRPREEWVVSIVDYSATLDVSGDASVPPTNRVLHRLGKVRRLQGVSRRLLARHMNVEVAAIRRQEESADLPISVLYAWQKVLEVPMAELLSDADENLSQPLLERARLVRLMKTALALLEQADSPAVRSMAQGLVDQLIKVMPELSGISPWHLVGQRRRRDELGVAAMRTLSEDVLINLDE